MRRLMLGIVVMGMASLHTRADGNGPLKQGDHFALGEARYVVTKVDALPYVENEYSKRFKFDSYDNPKLKELREGGHATPPMPAAAE